MSRRKGVMAAEDANQNREKVKASPLPWQESDTFSFWAVSWRPASVM